MALSLLSHPSYTDLQTYFDQSIIRNTTTTINTNNNFIDYYSFSNDDEMEFNSNSINDQNSSNHHNANNNNYNDYEQVIDFVDSPPNSKESWPGDYTKDNQQGPTIVNVQTIYSNNSNRKRRMDWEELDINQTANNNSEQSQNHNTKIPNLGDNKEREKKKSTGRGSWADDIDFDLNGEFSNNGYLNNAESFLSFSPALTVLKQEIPSPSSDLPQKGNKSPHQQQQNLTTDKIQPSEKEIINQPENSINGSPQQQQQSQQQKPVSQQPGSHPTLDNALNGTGLATNFQQLLQQDNLDNNSARNSPHHIENIKSDTASDDNKFQYILAAATSIATKSNEETLTYLNQGQSYEIKLKKIGDLSFYRDKLLKSVIKICFHERRLQYMEREQMHQWQSARPGERIIEVDIPLSYGLCHVTQSLNQQYLNTVEILWDPMKEVGVYIKVNCISTEFTPKKHGGEKGVPFRIQIETYLENGTNNTTNLISNNNNNNNSVTTPTTTTTININNNTNNNINNNNSPTNVNNNTNSDNNICLGKPIHAAACQIKVFKLKGADRKHKQDREKIQRRPPSEQEKYQPSYECTILNDISIDTIASTVGCYSPEYMKIWPNSPVHMPKYEGISPFTATTAVTANIPSPIAINSVTSTNTNNIKLMDQNMVSPQQVDMDDYAAQITKDSTPVQVSQWLTYHRLSTYLGTFAHFSGSDILRMSKEDLIQVCGLADGIRMFNTLHAKAITPRLTIYISFDGSSYHAIYLISNTIKELTYKIFKLPGFFELCANGGSNMNGIENNNGYPGWGMLSKYSGSGSNIYNDASKLNIYTTGPSGIHVMINDEVLSNAIKDNSLYSLEMLNGKILMKSVNKMDNINL